MLHLCEKIAQNSAYFLLFYWNSLKTQWNYGYLISAVHFTSYK